jgi:hypothetical protein
MDNKKITIDGKEYILVNIKSLKVNNNLYSDEINSSENISLTSEILEKEVINLSIQINK